MVSCQANKSATWTRGMHTSTRPSQHPSTGLFLPNHAFLGRRPLSWQRQAASHVVTVSHLVRSLLYQVVSPGFIFLLIFLLGCWFSKEQVCLSLQVISDLVGQFDRRTKSLFYWGPTSFIENLPRKRERTKGALTQQLNLYIRHQGIHTSFPHTAACGDLGRWPSHHQWWTRKGDRGKVPQSHPGDQRWVQREEIPKSCKLIILLQK